MNPYNNDPVTEKKSIFGHVQKRKGARLRKDIGSRGDGKVTDQVSNDFSLYYSMTICQNPDFIAIIKN